MTEARRGTRCAPCRGCGRCFIAADAASADVEAGARTAGSPEDVDASTGATSFADAARKLDDGSSPAPPAVAAAPGTAAIPGAAAAPGTPRRPRSPFATLKAADGEVDATTGATPGVSAACKEFGMDDSAAFAASRGVKPPGQA
ncbi:hypothetical protein [Adlercreutzia sp. ZJ242]|uniref:hypothetical protein n=1 Tax=Adlercreutzia sp. ZJ242 TaxID=2709409 RepID=UPI0013EBCCF4|nr:hypothetical protein [Adlercreutzia sp. ZJ242]